MSDGEELTMLQDVKVLSFAQLLQGPSGVQMLGDMGADVVKIERPETGEWSRNWSGADHYKNGESVFFMLTNRNQRSLTLNLKDERAVRIVKELVEEADILVENYRPGVMEKLGLGYEELSSVNEGLIYCSCSGYGAEGPYRDRPGQDLLLQAMTGLASITGRSEDPPIPTGTSVVDQHSATLLVCGVLGALYERTRTGEGQKVEVSLLRSAMDLQIEPINYFLNGAEEVTERSDSGLASTFHPAPYGIYRTEDGYLALSLTSLPELGELIDQPELEEFQTDRDALKHRDRIKHLVQERLSTRSTDHWLDVFQEADVWAGPVYSYEQVVEDPQVQAIDPFESCEHPVAGELKLLAHPIKYSSGEMSIRRYPPLLGEHNDEILESLGYSERQREKLRDQNVI